MVSPVRNNDGAIVGILELRGDATSNKRLEEENKQAFPLLPSDLEGIAEGVVVVDSVYKYSTGVDRLMQQHMFEPFFATRGKGCGLGFAVVCGIMKKTTDSFMYAETQAPNRYLP